MITYIPAVERQQIAMRHILPMRSSLHICALNAPINICHNRMAIHRKDIILICNYLKIWNQQKSCNNWNAVTLVTGPRQGKVLGFVVGSKRSWVLCQAKTEDGSGYGVMGTVGGQLCWWVTPRSIRVNLRVNLVTSKASAQSAHQLIVFFSSRERDEG